MTKQDGIFCDAILRTREEREIVRESEKERERKKEGESVKIGIYFLQITNRVSWETIRPILYVGARRILVSNVLYYPHGW